MPTLMTGFNLGLCPRIVWEAGLARARCKRWRGSGTPAASRKKNNRKKAK